MPLRNANTELIRTNWPRLAMTWSMPAATVLTTPVTLTASVASTSAAGVLRSVAALASRPALAITTSIRPKRSTVCATTVVERGAVADVGDAAEVMTLAQIPQGCSSNFPTWWRCQL